MRGDERLQDGMFSYVTLEQRVPQDHPLREIRKLTDVVLRSLSGKFDELYAGTGRSSIAPEYILRALLLQAFYSVRSERQLCEQIDYNLLFRWFVGLGLDDRMWNHAVFSKNRDRLLNSEVAQEFFAAVNQQATRFMSDEHFTVDGTLIAAWASQKSFRPKDGSDKDDDGTNFHGGKRSNETHESTTDPDARQADRADRANQGARTASGRCRLCLRMRRTKPAATTQADRAGNHPRPSVAARLKPPRKAPTEPPPAAKHP